MHSALTPAVMSRIESPIATPTRGRVSASRRLNTPKGRFANGKSVSWWLALSTQLLGALDEAKRSRLVYRLAERAGSK